MSSLFTTQDLGVNFEDSTVEGIIYESDGRLGTDDESSLLLGKMLLSHQYEREEQQRGHQRLRRGSDSTISSLASRASAGHSPERNDDRAEDDNGSFSSEQSKTLMKSDLDSDEDGDASCCDSSTGSHRENRRCSQSAESFESLEGPTTLSASGSVGSFGSIQSEDDPPTIDSTFSETFIPESLIREAIASSSSSNSAGAQALPEDLFTSETSSKSKLMVSNPCDVNSAKETTSPMSSSQQPEKCISVISAEYESSTDAIDSESVIAPARFLRDPPTENDDERRASYEILPPLTIDFANISIDSPSERHFMRILQTMQEENSHLRDIVTKQAKTIQMVSKSNGELAIKYQQAVCALDEVRNQLRDTEEENMMMKNSMNMLMKKLSSQKRVSGKGVSRSVSVVHFHGESIKNNGANKALTTKSKSISRIFEKEIKKLTHANIPQRWRRRNTSQDHHYGYEDEQISFIPDSLRRVYFKDGDCDGCVKDEVTNSTSTDTGGSLDSSWSVSADYASYSEWGNLS
mmetsp:Transcript_17215/g.35947  ORF Transcript_17215/g.35947 Transcript_17215/m.35947 type:complete len:520 (+) Transcript_17215:245-1804(+)